MSDLGERLIAGERRALAKAITLVESTRDADRAAARELLDELLPATGKAIRIGLSGAPGVGKSTLVEALGLHAIRCGHRVAVLAIDPSSTRSGGSVLGDKTRMSDLGREPAAYIRPTPAGGTLGGVAQRTREALLLCEAAGHDLIIVETVGVGQSEVAVDDLVDLFVLIASPAGGDELQGIKRGIMELADLIVVNKADGDLLDAARRASLDLRTAVHLLRPKHPGWTVEVHTCSARTGEGIPQIWDLITTMHERLKGTGILEARRAEQATAWMWSQVTETLLERLRRHPAVHTRLEGLQADVAAGRTSPRAAADELVAALDLLDPG